MYQKTYLLANTRIAWFGIQYTKGIVVLSISSDKHKLDYNDNILIKNLLKLDDLTFSIYPLLIFDNSIFSTWGELDLELVWGWNFDAAKIKNSKAVGKKNFEKIIDAYNQHNKKHNNLTNDTIENEIIKWLNEIIRSTSYPTYC